MKSNQKSSSNLAKARLRNILITDRLKVSPEIADQIKVKILESLNQYVEIDDEGVILELNNNSGTVTLSTTVPIKQLKKR
ncbi:cell division topological specificity factor MinE [Clostridium sp. 'deep sea']|uniref:cell division topological specificity factor MinE n=1 Tax=Clostridium sp. 'deep sea' TaxID=2779445 RepID=UPI001A9BE3C0|nr:cell division topological specificity factor MinE [Clostridium sp. 'deep sea']